MVERSPPEREALKSNHSQKRLEKWQFIYSAERQA